MKRPMLVSGTAIGLSSAILVLLGIQALPFLILGAVSVFILYFIKPLNLKGKIIIPTFCISVIISCIFFGIYHFTKIIPAQNLDNTTTTISGKIITTPRETAYGTQFTLKADKIGNENKSCKISIYLKNGYDDLKLYDYISLPDTELKIILNQYNKPDASSISDNIILETEAQTCSFLWESEKTPYYYCLRFKEIITRQISAYLPEYEAGFLLGMLFGDKTELDSDISNDFRATGIAHLLAVSGLHTSTWCAYIISFLKLFKLKEKTRNIFCLLFLVLLCIASAFTPSVMRASIMMTIVLVSPFFNEQQDPLNSLGFSIAVLTLHNPYIVTSASFLLSVFATLGVLCAIYAVAKINPFINKIKSKPIKIMTDKLSDSIITSVFAGIFTLPFCTYFFGVFSTLAPITNLLCVYPAFLGMLTGTIATFISFIPLNSIQDISIFIFKTTSLLLNYVTKVAHTLEKFRFCTIPAHKEYFIAGLLLTILICFTGFMLYNKNRKKQIFAVSAISSVIAIILCLALPCTNLTPATLSVIDVKNGVNIALRQGLEYAYFNCGTSADNRPYNYLPSAKCETLKLLYVNKSDNITDTLTNTLVNTPPQTTVITEYSKGKLNESHIIFPPNTIISDTYSCNFNQEITLQIVDTYPVYCVIIKDDENTVAVCCGNTDINFLFENYGVPDTLVLSDYIPEKLPQNVETIIISSDSNVILNENIATLKKQCNKFYTTAENGDIKLFL